MNKRLFAYCLLACIAVALIGFFIGTMADLPKTLFPESARPEAGVLAKVRNASTFKTIFLNNSRVFAAMVVGILTCGLLSLFEILLVGAMVGFIYKVTSGQGISLALIAAALVPHGVFELLSFLVVGAVGFYFAVQLYRSSKGSIIIDWTKEAKAYALVVAGAYGVLVVAAALETYLTPLVVERLLR